MIEYEFTFPDGRVEEFVVDEGVPPARTDAVPEWAALGFHQCPNCPLRLEVDRWCPPAADLAAVADRFRQLLSYESVRVRVRREGREHELVGDVQTGLGSLIGLVMASSACPILGQLRGLARLHLPFATFEESLFRTVGLYLLKQYFVAADGGRPDYSLAGLSRLYEELQVVNRAFKGRAQAASERDANVNAVTQLFSLSALVSMSLESGLDQLRELLFADGAAFEPPITGADQEL